jgi:hypothetical protein
MRSRRHGGRDGRFSSSPAAGLTYVMHLRCARLQERINQSLEPAAAGVAASDGIRRLVATCSGSKLWPLTSIGHRMRAFFVGQRHRGLLPADALAQLDDGRSQATRLARTFRQY